MTTNPPAVSDATLERVLAVIEAEADMDGVSTPGCKRVGELVGIHTNAAWWAIHRLADTGRLTIIGTSGVNVLTLQLAEVDA